jgi:leucyl-tRNA synthetase
MSDERYDPQQVEARWQQAWADANAFATTGEGEPYYVLEMFPYPSGALHMGHVRNYTIGDVFARYGRMRGRDVLHPMGWDSLGLPAENQAIREKIAPQVRTPKNIAQMRAQMRRLGFAYDWDRELATHTPEYYRWNQWLFTRFLARGLVYRRTALVNWCTGCDTVLANEQVSDDGVCWRGHDGVTSRSIPEWAYRITAYADELLRDLDKLGEWPSRIVTQQRNWIGKSVGAEIDFTVPGGAPIRIFTTRVDTIYGCTYLVVAPEHPRTIDLASPTQRAEVATFVAAARQQDARLRTAAGAEKIGVFTGAHAINPFNGRKVPIWTANFVLAGYGTGAVMSVPAHDQRDYEFAKKYALPIETVILGATEQGCAFTGDGMLTASGSFDGLTSNEARAQMAVHADAEGFGHAAVTWHLRDWGFSRQRYWGTPIPIIHCPGCGAVPVPDSDLPVLLPDFDAVELTGQGGAPLGKLASFVNATCPRCGATALRETETMDTFVDSAWYFARFLSPRLTTAPVDTELARRWLPIDVYIGGPEHAVMHLLYFRFWTKAMRDLGLVDVDEPATKLITQGMVNAPAYRCPAHGYVPAEDAPKTCPRCDGPLEVATVKMSKSKYNGIDPMDIIDRYGADTARLYTLFAAPPHKDLEWSHEGVEGIHRFVGRLHRLALAQRARTRGATLPTSLEGLGAVDASVRRAVHKTLEKVGREIGERIHFNTAIAAMMELCNALHEHHMHTPECAVSPGVAREALARLAQMLSPLAPHLAEELWQWFGHGGLVGHTRWPSPDPDLLVQDTVALAVQVNGKLRGEIRVAADADRDAILSVARADEKVAPHLEARMIKRAVVVPGRLVNFVV